VAVVRRRSPTRNAALIARTDLPELARFAPSLRSVAVGVAIVALAAGAYALARETSMFAVQTVDVRGGTPALRTQVRAALAGVREKSLVRVDGDTVANAVAPIPGVREFSYDRAFPHTLRVTVAAEHPVLVLRQVPGPDAYLVAASGRVIRLLVHPLLSSLPRLWVTKDVPIVVGQHLRDGPAGAATALGDLRGAPLPGGVVVVRVGQAELTLVLRHGLEVRLGDPGDVRLKLAVARRILRATDALASGSGYLDVSVPERPVLGQKSQVGG